MTRIDTPGDSVWTSFSANNIDGVFTNEKTHEVRGISMTSEVKKI